MKNRDQFAKHGVKGTQFPCGAWGGTPPKQAQLRKSYQREKRRGGEEELIVDEVGGLGASETIGDMAVFKVASTGLCGGGATVAHFTRANDADVSDTTGIFPRSDGGLTVVGGSLGFSGADLSPTVAFAVVDEPIVSSVGVEFAALAEARGVSVAVDPVGDLRAHRFGDVPRKDIAVSFALALVVFLVAAVAFDVELVDDMGVCVGATLTRAVLDRGIDGAPRLGVRSDARRGRGGVGRGCVGCGCVGCGCVGRGCIRIDRCVAVAGELIEIDAVGTGSVLCAFVGVSALSVEVVDQVLVGAQTVLVGELLNRTLGGSGLCRLCRSIGLCRRAGESGVAIANKVVHIEAKAACVVGSAFVGVSALLIGVIDHVLVGSKVGMFAQDAVEWAF